MTSTPVDPSIDPLVDALREVVGPDHVIVDRDVMATYETDWLRQWHGRARLVVRPGDTDETAAVVRACADAGTSIVPQGGNTGLVGGGVPRGGEVVLSTRRLGELGAVDTSALQVTAGAGVTIEQLRQHARAAGVDVPVDWGARASATVGGAVSTNAGGSRVVRFGTMRANVMGVRAVLADGSVLDDMHGLPKQTAGAHLPGLVVGTEGTIAVVTAARLRLVPWYRHTAAALVGFDSLVHAVGALGRIRTLPSLDAVELLMPEALDVACAHLGITPPLSPRSAGAFVLVDCAASVDPTDELAGALDMYKGVLAAGAQRDQLFAIRDHVTIAIGALGDPLKLDVAVPVHHLDRLHRRIVTTVTDRAPQSRLVVFGHLAEGNLHVNVLGLSDDQRAAIREAVLSTVVGLGGTVSAEHGIGVAKVDWMERQHGAVRMSVLGALKDSLDPRGVLNPGVLLPRRVGHG